MSDLDKQPNHDQTKLTDTNQNNQVKEPLYEIKPEETKDLPN